MGSCFSTRRNTRNDEDGESPEGRNNAFDANSYNDQQIPESLASFFSFFPRNSPNTAPSYSNTSRGTNYLNHTFINHNFPENFGVTENHRIPARLNNLDPQREAEVIAALQNQLRGMETFFNNLFQQQAPPPSNRGSNGGNGFPGFFFGGPENSFPGFQGAPPQEERTIPPASKKALRQIPTIQVTPEDLIDESNRECCICLEENKLGDKVARLPCGHLFHRPCVTDWLVKHNTCPICRYELETDDLEFERGRKARMSSRKPRFRPYELKRMGIRELKSLGNSLGLQRMNSVVEKEELVQKIINSGKIDIVASAEPVEYKLSELRSMGVGRLKKAMTEGGVFFDPVDVLEKEDMVQIFLNSGRLIALPEDDIEEEINIHDAEKSLKNSEEIQEDAADDRNYSNHSTDAMDIDDTIPREDPVPMEEESQPEQDYDTHESPSITNSSIEPPHTFSPSHVHQPSSYPTTSSQTSLSTHSISQLKSFARELNVNVSDCVEKREMIERIVNAVERTGAPPRQRRRL